MQSPIKLEKNKIKLSSQYLQVPEILVWVGHGFDPLDNDDKRVEETREFMKKYYSHIPHGMSIGNKNSDDSFIPVKDTDGYYDLDVSWWPEGVYRFNYHTLPGIQSDVGTKLNPDKRDLDVSWVLFDNWDKEVKKLAEPFVHKEKSGAGYSFRILIKPDRTIEPFGDQNVSF